MATKKQSVVTTTQIADLSFEKPAQILSRMRELKDSLSVESNEANVLIINLELNALAKAFTKLLVESFSCSDEATESIMDSKMSSNEGFTISINNIMYSYTKESVSKKEIDKAYLNSIGFKNQTEYGRHLENNNLSLPDGLVKEVMYKFKPDAWKGDPIGTEVTTDVITIKDKEIKK
jgi:hypothetical protein